MIRNSRSVSIPKKNISILSISLHGLVISLISQFQKLLKLLKLILSHSQCQYAKRQYVSVTRQRCPSRFGFEAKAKFSKNLSTIAPLKILKRQNIEVISLESHFASQNSVLYTKEVKELQMQALSLLFLTQQRGSESGALARAVLSRISLLLTRILSSKATMECSTR